ncbi:hypothetical protein VB264_20655 [Arcicella aquatica]|uniref:DUF4263 domain-containing protein n=1 Tax=Arcicella aquatica TaxID=217141 RepID=A0ABU5QSZ2_9BACT|nr:hypothetical protein [Arcicella aquatica]MEA5260222.1 hypothetical protein [Arcicella aquatica]
MTTKKKLGIWMDHSTANLMEYSNIFIERKIITSDFTHEEKEQSLSKSENIMHNKEQHLEMDFYKKIATEIIGYDEVLLFGPTDAKVELFNILNQDQHYKNIKIEVKTSDKMTDNQQVAYVRNYFNRL